MDYIYLLAGTPTDAKYFKLCLLKVIERWLYFMHVISTDHNTQFEVKG